MRKLFVRQPFYNYHKVALEENEKRKKYLAGEISKLQKALSNRSVNATI